MVENNQRGSKIVRPMFDRVIRSAGLGEADNHSEIRFTYGDDICLLLAPGGRIESAEFLPHSRRGPHLVRSEQLPPIRRVLD